MGGFAREIYLPLLYHDIVREEERDGGDVEVLPYRISEPVFGSQVRLLREAGFEGVTSRDLVAALREGRPLPERAVLITFDDGQQSNYTTALPVLKRYGYQAIFFVTAGWVGREGMLTWSQLAEMHRQGMEIGSHTMTHPIPTSLREEDLRGEVFQSKEVLEEGLGAPVRSLSSPTGFHDGRMRRLAADAGYDALYVGITSLLRQPCVPRNLYWINRLDVRAGMRNRTFEGLLRGGTFPILRLSARDCLLDRAKAWLGAERYNRLRRRLLRYASPLS